MDEKNILDFQEPSILEVYHADRSMKCLLRGFLLFIISFISICAFLYLIIAFNDLKDGIISIILVVLFCISLLSATIFTILGLYHLVYGLIKKEILTDRRLSWLILLGVVDFIALLSCIVIILDM